MSEFLAEAAVLIAADTRAFRTELAAALATVPKAIEIPIVAIGAKGTTAAQTAAAAAKEAASAQAAATTASAGRVAAGQGLVTVLEQESSAATTAAVAEQRLAAAYTEASAINSAFARTEKAVALARLEVVGAASAQQAAEISLARQTAAGVAARELLTAAQLHGVETQTLLQTGIVKTAIAMGADAAAAERDAAAHELAATAAKHHAVQAANVARGSSTAALSAVGLRGATLTANAAFIAGAAAAIGFGKAIQTATSFDTSLNTFAATVGATGAQMADVSRTAQQLGKDITLPSVNAQDAADAMLELAKAGLSVEDSMAGARGVLQLATAAAIDNAQATELAASALNAFGLSGDQAVHVADVLTNAANESQGSIVDMGNALGQAAAVARQAGLSLETTSAILTLFARNGLRGSDAGTSLRTGLIRLINPTDKAAKVIRDLGLNIRTATGAVDVTVFDQFAKATRNMTSAQRDQALAVIFGQDAIRGAAILAREGAAGLTQETNAMNKAGSAAELAAARTKGLAGAFENAKNQAAQFGLTIGQLASGPVQGLLIGVGNLFQSLNTASEKIRNFISPKAFDPATANLAEFVGQLQQLQAFKLGNIELAPAINKQIDEISNNLARAGDDLVRKGFLTRFIEVFKSLSPDVKKAMEDNVISPSEQAQLSADGIGRAFLKALPHTSEFFQSFGLAAQGSIESARDEFATGGPLLGAALRSSIEDASAQAKQAAALGGHQTGDEFFGGFQKSVSENAPNLLTGLRLNAGSLQSQLVDVQFRGGSPQEQLTNLNKLLDTQQQIVDDLIGRGAPRGKIDQAKKDAISTEQEIAAVQSQIDSANKAATDKVKQVQSAREQRAREAQAARDKADQAVLDSFTGAQNRIDLAQIDANATKRLSDDIAVQRLIANTASREIAVIEKTVKDVKTRNAAIAARVQILKAAGAELDRLRKEQADAAAGRAQSAREAATATLEKKLQLAQIIGKKDPILKAFDALIANERKSLAAAKKADKLDALIKLRQTIKDKADFIEGLKKDTEDANKQATTAFDLLSQFSQVFNQNAGNLIGGNQPFAGPTGFTADIAQFLIRRQPPPTATTAARPTTDKLVTSNQALVDAINRLRDSFEGSVPGPVSAFPNVTVPAGTARKWHRANTFAREFQES